MNVLEKLQPMLSSQRYGLGLAASLHDVALAQALRYEVFNRELGEGLSASDEQQRDVDAFDSVCDHLLVKDLSNNQVVGTYRMQTGVVAQRNLGYYCAQEFDLTVFEAYRSETVELGRTRIADEALLPEINLPKLLSAYMSLGAWICGPPAIDREFKTIDFLTLMDLQSDSMKLRRQRFGITN